MATVIRVSYLVAEMEVGIKQSCQRHSAGLSKLLLNVSFTNSAHLILQMSEAASSIVSCQRLENLVCLHYS